MEKRGDDPFWYLTSHFIIQICAVELIVEQISMSMVIMTSLFVWTGRSFFFFFEEDPPHQDFNHLNNDVF